MPTIKELIDWLRDDDPYETIAYSIWRVEDVFEKAEEMGIVSLSEEEAIEILNRIHLTMDASIGINWDVLDYYITEVWHENHIQNRKGENVNEVKKTETRGGAGEIGGEAGVLGIYEEKPEDNAR